MTKEIGNGANLGFENQLWAAADKLRGHMDAWHWFSLVDVISHYKSGYYDI